MDFLSLVGSGCLASTDSPDWLVCYNDVLEFLCREIEYAALELCLANLVLLLSLTLSESLADAEDHFQTVLQCEQHLLLQNLRSLVVVLAALRVAKNNILCSSALYHLGRNLASEGALLLVGAVLGTKSDDVLIEELCDACQVNERSTDNHAAVWLLGCQCLVKLLCKSDTILQVHVHLPVACYNFLSHCFTFLYMLITTLTFSPFLPCSS